MDLKEKIEADFKEALKNKEELKLSTLRMLRAGFKNEEIKKGSPLDKEEILKLIKSEIKKRKDSLESFKKAGREDLVSKEEKELDILKKYLPQQLGEEELKNIIKETIQDLSEAEKQNFGKVMGKVMAKVKGSAEGQLVNRLVKEELEK